MLKTMGFAWDPSLVPVLARVLANIILTEFERIIVSDFNNQIEMIKSFISLNGYPISIRNFLKTK